MAAAPWRRTDVSGGRVAVVVPCKDEVGTIGTTLAALRAQEPAPDLVVVVDNRSSDGSLDVAKELADDVVELPSGSISAVRNAGAAAAGPVDVLAFVDADTEVQPGWLAAGLAALDAGADLVGSRTQASPGAGWVASRWAHIEEVRAHGGSRVWSQHLILRAETFAALGGFAEIPTGEDADLSMRTVEAGGVVELVPSMRAVHHGFPDDLRSFLRRERWHTRAPGWFARMSRGSRALVLAGAGWTAVGGLLAVRALAGRGAGPVSLWTAATAA